MTREEAINTLHELWRETHDPWYEETYEMAIEALKVKTDGDLISRQDAIDALGEEPPVWYDGDDEIAERNQWRRDKAAIESLPSAEPKTGEWDDIGGFIRWGCPFCHHAYESRSNYCPNCGARMRGEEA